MPNLKCRQCGQSFASKDSFRTHYHAAHDRYIRSNDAFSDFALGAAVGILFSDFSEHSSHHYSESSDPSSFHGDGGSFGGGGSSGGYDSPSSDSGSSSSDSGDGSDSGGGSSE